MVVRLLRDLKESPQSPENKAPRAIKGTKAIKDIKDTKGIRDTRGIRVTPVVSRARVTQVDGTQLCLLSSNSVDNIPHLRQISTAHRLKISMVHRLLIRVITVHHLNNPEIMALLRIKQITVLRLRKTRGIMALLPLTRPITDNLIRRITHPHPLIKEATDHLKVSTAKRRMGNNLLKVNTGNNLRRVNTVNSLRKVSTVSSLLKVNMDNNHRLHLSIRHPHLIRVSMDKGLPLSSMHKVRLLSMDKHRLHKGIHNKDSIPVERGTSMRRQFRLLKRKLVKRM